MVFYIVAAHLAEKDEADVERVMRTNCIGSGPKANGEVYNIEVSSYPIYSVPYLNFIDWQIKIQSRNAGLSHGAEWISG